MPSVLQPKDRGQDLNSNGAFTLLWINWRIIGMHPPRRFRYLYNVYAFVSCVFSAVGLPATLMVKLLTLNGLAEIIGNLYLNVTITVATAKHLTLLFYRDALLEVGEYFHRLDKRCNTHPEDRRHILSSVRLCRLFFIVFMGLYSTIALGFSYLGFKKRQLVYNGWYPQFFDDPADNLMVALCYQNWAILSFFVFQNCNNDVYPVTYIVMVVGHLRALSSRIERIGKDRTISVDDNYKELLQCVQDHKNILKILDCIRPAISRTLALQFIVTAIVLCLTAINVIAFEVDFAQLLFTATYLMAILIEVFPCTWFVNTLLEQDFALTQALYGCLWYEQHHAFRRVLIIFLQRSQKENMITAGKLAPVTLQTFLAVIKFSFSMFTLLTKMNIKNAKM